MPRRQTRRLARSAAPDTLLHALPKLDPADIAAAIPPGAAPGTAVVHVARRSGCPIIIPHNLPPRIVRPDTLPALAGAAVFIPRIRFRHVLFLLLRTCKPTRATQSAAAVSLRLFASRTSFAPLNRSFHGLISNKRANKKTGREPRVLCLSRFKMKPPVQILSIFRPQTGTIHPSSLSSCAVF